MSNDAAAARKAAEQFKTTYAKIRDQIQRAMVGQEDVIEGVLTALLAGGHVLLEGVPGLGKTLLISSLGRAVDLDFSRIQFTPDMMPADVIGTQVLVEQEGGGHEVQFQEGPLVSNLVLADEINRATPKTQSALLQAMQERQISVGRKTIELDEPYCVMATQNPVEQEGTYPLPEAQLDRFLFKLIVGYPKESEYSAILDRTVGDDDLQLEAVSNGAEILAMRHVVRQVPVPDHVKQYAIHLVMGTQPGSDHAPALVNDSVALGSSPRGAQALLLAGKVSALLAGRYAVSSEDVRKVATNALRHRIIVNFQGQSDGVSADDVVAAVLAHVKPATEAAVS
ncbi:MAG: MoxR family ATPase [Planctomycetota bacterium]|nr:MoxR family ATPase [Planctomycetota bacterium]